MKKELTKTELKTKGIYGSTITPSVNLEVDHDIGIGSQTPVKKLDVKGYSKTDTIIIRIICWYFHRKNIGVSFFRRSEMNDPSSTLHISTNRNVGIGS